MVELPEAEPGWQPALAEEPEVHSVAARLVLLHLLAVAQGAVQLDWSARGVEALEVLPQLEPVAAQPV